MKPTEMDKTRPDGSTYIPDYTDGRAFIEAWKTENPMEYDERREEWRVYLEAIGEIPTTEVQDRTSEPYNVEMAINQQAHGNATVLLEDDLRKPKSWLGRVFKR